MAYLIQPLGKKTPAEGAHNQPGLWGDKLWEWTEKELEGYHV
jgi:hypothetical protein